MPRVDMGMKALDIGLALSLDSSRREAVIRLALEAATGGVRIAAVTKPSIVAARVELRTVKIALGVGSLVMDSEVADSVEDIVGRRLPELSAPAWVDGCWLGGEKVLEYAFISGSDSIAGRVVPASLEDPIALLLAGARAEASGPVPPPRAAPIAYIESIPVAARDAGGDYLFSITGGEARERLTYALPLLSRCRGL